jgi:hypothetical protein
VVGETAINSSSAVDLLMAGIGSMLRLISFLGTNMIPEAL